ncbi:MAG: dipeptide/oligopeptide/nickel ABC transporter ATP-binding protein [Spirochaetaceae bacterium]|jgi:ABC-type glutathione transport system ATPase component|nr:dipeptide/oligopeptide/nickel ABC transporter ATP-binding protein [Spirochaetaceae bacterium]
MLLEVKDLVKVYRGGLLGGKVSAVLDHISFEMKQGELLGIMGHSGCGKTTAAKIIASLIRPSSGRILFNGKDILKSPRRDTMRRRRELQIIFQNAKLALNPQYTIRKQIEEPIRLFALAQNKYTRGDLVKRSMDSVGLSGDLLDRYPNEISGGQAQRVAIARALILSPKLLIADEATSMLDLSVQAQIIALFKEIHKKRRIAILMISHDKSVVEHFCDRTIVMEKGRIIDRYYCNN